MARAGALQPPDASVVPVELKSKHETVFSVFLLALAFLFRNQPSIAYPELPLVFVAFLAFNFLYNRFLKQKVQSSTLAYSPVFVNGILITSAIHYSGGSESYLWVMYLLPIFTACLLYDVKGIILSTIYVLLLHASVYGGDIWQLDDTETLQFLGKSGLLVLSASLTARLAWAERAAQASALAQRLTFEKTLEKIRGGGGDSGPADPGAGSLLSRGIHDVNTALSIILGSAQLMISQLDLDEATRREDLGRIESSVRLGKVIMQNIFLLGHSQEDWPREVFSIHDLLTEAAEDCRGEVRSRRISLDLALQAGKDGVCLSRRLLQQAFSNFLFAAVAATPPEQRVRIATRLESGAGREKLLVMIEDGGIKAEGEGLKTFFDPQGGPGSRGKGLGLGLYLGREIIIRHGGQVAVSPLEERGNRVEIRFALEGNLAEGSPIRLKDLVLPVN